MSFGGGGGSSGVSAHIHTNAAGEGGNLTLATLMPDATYTLSNTMNLRSLIFG
jgi:hypothetical protein